ALAGTRVCEGAGIKTGARAKPARPPKRRRKRRLGRHQGLRGARNWALPDRRQLPLEGRALSLEPRRQSESLAERLLRFVDEEPRAVGRDLEQDPVGQAEVDRAEVLAVLHRRRVQADLAEALAPDLLRVVVCGAPRNVVNRS